MPKFAFHVERHLPGDIINNTHLPVSVYGDLFTSVNGFSGWPRYDYSSSELRLGLALLLG